MQASRPANPGERREPGVKTNPDLWEFNTQSFIVRIWVEESDPEAGETCLRGHITHVPTGKRRYVQQVDEIVEFIESYLREMGVAC
jgi:hypothetical protein